MGIKSSKEVEHSREWIGFCKIINSLSIVRAAAEDVPKHAELCSQPIPLVVFSIYF